MIRDPGKPFKPFIFQMPLPLRIGTCTYRIQVNAPAAAAATHVIGLNNIVYFHWITD